MKRLSLSLTAFLALFLAACATAPTGTTSETSALAVTPAQAQAAACQALNAAAPKLQARIGSMTSAQLAAADVAAHTILSLCTGPAPTSVADFESALAKASGDLAAALTPAAPASAASN